ncbi:MAG: sugar phosphate isomerase/epimerase family protein [Candidatus Altimarinota bacterium]
MFLLSTDSLRGYGLNRIFQMAKDSGFEGVEVALDLRQFDTQNAEYLNELQKQYSLPIRVIRTFPNSTIKQTELAISIADAVDAKVVVIEPPRLFDFKYKDWIKKQVPLLRKKYQLSIALKNGPSEYLWGILPGRAMNNIPDLQNFKEVCLDVSNLYGMKLDLMRAYDVMKSYLSHVHLSNVYRGIDHSLLDEGIMPLESFLTKLKRDEYDKDISLVVRPKSISAGDDKAVMKNLQRARKFYDKYMV